GQPPRVDPAAADPDAGRHRRVLRAVHRAARAAVRLPPPRRGARGGHRGHRRAAAQRRALGMTGARVAEDERLAGARAALREQGWAHLPGAVDEETVAALRAAIGAAPAERGNAYGVIRHNVWEEDPTFAAFVREGPLGAL